MHRRAIPRRDLRDAGYAAVFHGQKSYNGVAILREGRAARSAHRIVRRQSKTIRRESLRRMSAMCGCSRFMRRMDRPSARRPTNSKWSGIVVSRISCESTEAGLDRTVVCGDFNVAPNDADVHDPALWRGAIMCSDGERAAFRALKELGLADTLRLHHPEPGIFSWWDYRMLAFPKNRGLRIDAILAGSELAAKCIDGGVEREMRKGKEPSDHAPVWAEFE